jgi:hypothetical protein
MTEYALYLDDSGHPSDQPAVVVAGFVATIEQWQQFGPEWSAALHKHGLGNTFHMTDFEAAKRRDRGKVFEHLTSIISRYTQASFSCGVDMKAYRKVNDRYALEEAIGTPYAIATRGVVRNLNLWKKRFLDVSETVTVFVEEGTKHFGDMEEAFRRDTLPVPQRVPKRHVCVQPADMLAWEAFNYDSLRPARRSLRNLVDSERALETNHGKFLESNILESCSRMEIIHLRKEIPATMQHVYHSSPKRLRKRTIE